MTDLTRSRVRGSMVSLLVGCFLCLFCAALARAALPDGRGYEQVSPVDKNGGDIGFIFAQPDAGVAVSQDSNSVVFFSATPFGDAPNGLLTVYYRAGRGASGWNTKSMSYPLPVDSGVLSVEVPGIFDASLGHAVFSSLFPYDPADDDASPPDLPVGVQDQYLFGGPSPLWLSRGSMDVGGDMPADSTFGGASTDLSHVVFETPEPLAPEAGAALPQFSNQFYVYKRSGDQTELVNVDSNDQLIDPAGARLGNGGPTETGGPANESGTTAHAVSSDGSKIFFESPPPGSGTVQLYRRDTTNGTTVHVSAPNTGVVDPNGTQDALFAGASADGSKVFFTTTQQLTADDTNTTDDVYEYDFGTHKLTRVSSGETGDADADVLGFVLASDDGSTVYFVASHQLVGTDGTDGSPNLYRYNTTSGDTTFVGTLDASDQSRVWAGDDGRREAFATGDGGVLTFTSAAQLTVFDPSGHREVYLYRSSDESIICASCPTGGAPAAGDADFGPGPNRGGFMFPLLPKPLTTDGSRVFFETTDSLVPEDSNGGTPGTFSVPGGLDVYEYENGHASLISDGHSSAGSLLVGVSDSGDDAFIETRASLVPQDTDGGLYDVYDARVGGGFPTPPGTAPCQDDGCHGQPTEAPFLPAASSATATPDDSVLPAPSFTVRSISRAAANRAARTGRLALTIHVTASGQIMARAFASVRGHKRRMASSSRTFSRAGTGHLTLKLSKAARARLRSHSRLALRIEVTYSRGNLERVAHVTLRRSSQ